jgi:putative oxidoreductase
MSAVFTVHGAAGVFFTNKNGGWEYPAFWALAPFVVALLGDGAYAMVRTPVPWAPGLMHVHKHE